MSHIPPSTFDDPRRVEEMWLEQTSTERTRSSNEMNGASAWLVRGLGLFSIGLGAAQLFATDSMARMIGARSDGKTKPLLRLVGLREITTGVGILSSYQPKNWLRSRVGSDVMDLALLGAAFRSDGAEQGRLVGATMAVAGVAVIDAVAAARSSHADGRASQPEVRHSISVMCPVERVYSYWRDFSNLPRFMQHLESVTRTNDDQWHWVVGAPFGRRVEWDAEVVADALNERIAWRSVPGSTIETSGEVRFKPAPGNRGTEVHVTLRYALPGGKASSALARIFHENPERGVYEDLRGFKQMLETGEIVKSEAVLSGGRLHQRPAQPAANSSASHGKNGRR